jgi:hypothetical protein
MTDTVKRIKQALKDLEAVSKKIRKQSELVRICGIRGHDFWRSPDGNYSCLDCGGAKDDDGSTHCRHDWREAMSLEVYRKSAGCEPGDIVCFKCRNYHYAGTDFAKAIRETHALINNVYCYRKRKAK